MATKTKKVTTKKVATPKVQEEIKFKQFGKTLKVVIGEETFTKTSGDKKVRDAIISAIAAFNTSNSIAKKKVITSLLEIKVNPVKTTKAEVIEKAKKIAKAPKKEKVTEKASVITLEQAKKMLEKDGYTVSKTAPASARRRGEY